MTENPCGVCLKWSCLRARQYYMQLDTILHPTANGGTHYFIYQRAVLGVVLVLIQEVAGKYAYFNQKVVGGNALPSKSGWGTPVSSNMAAGEGGTSVFSAVYVQQLRIQRSLKAALRACRLFTE